MQRSTQYEACFKEAFTAYQEQSNRSGYGFGWFSWLRHSQSLYPHIEALKNNLSNNAMDVEAQKKILHEYFKSPLTKFNNHSFSIYFLDALVTMYPEEKEIWETYYPPKKKLIFYQGVLYRGMRLQEWQLHDIFQEGLDARRSSNWIDDYVSDTSMSMGLSTSKDINVAKRYASSVISRGIREAGQIICMPGYLFKINYRGLGGIDIIPTLETRDENVSAFLGESKKEVNIVGHIDAADIEGAWYVGNDEKEIKRGFIQNKHYQKIRETCDIAAVTLPHKLNNLFGMSK